MAGRFEGETGSGGGAVNLMNGGVGGEIVNRLWHVGHATSLPTQVLSSVICWLQTGHDVLISLTHVSFRSSATTGQGKSHGRAAIAL